MSESEKRHAEHLFKRRSLGIPAPVAYSLYAPRPTKSRDIRLGDHKFKFVLLQSLSLSYQHR